MHLEGKVVLITGASQGIGAACAEAFSRRGARLSLTARSDDKLRQVGGDQTLVTAGDLREPELRQRVVDRTLERFGAIDVLVNNAGVGMYAPAWRAPFDAARELFELNFFCALAMIQLVVPHMRERRSGTIVNVGSIAGKITLPWFTLYSASKYALGSLTNGLRMELAGDGVHAMIVCPGYVDTRFQDHVLGGRPPETIRRGRAFAISARTCAEAIARGVERQASTVVTPRTGWLLIALARMFPALVDGRIARINRRLESGPAQ